jgi:hypothetical protein
MKIHHHENLKSCTAHCSVKLGIPLEEIMVDILYVLYFSHDFVFVSELDKDKNM